MDGGSTEHPLGATWDGAGVDFALFSAHARAIELCLFAADVPARESRRIPLTRGPNDVWHTHVDGVGSRTTVRLPRRRPVRPT